MQCIKCGNKLKDGDGCCVHCGYVNNLISEDVYEDNVVNEISKNKIVNYKKIVKKTVVVIITIVMISAAVGGGLLLLLGGEELRAAIGLVSSSHSSNKKEVMELLRGAKIGMSREEILKLESEYTDSVKELNNEKYITYTGNIYGGYEGRTSYEFMGNNLREISVIFYPNEDINIMFTNLVNSFNEEYGQVNQQKSEEESSEEGTEESTELANEVQWKSNKTAIKLEKGEHIKLTVNKAK